MAASKFDFFGGGNMASCAEAIVNGNKSEDDLRNIVAPAYEIVYDINKVKANSEKPYYLINPPHTCWTKCKDNCEGVDLAKILAKSIDVLSTNEKGFYIMLECGRIDHAGHANDAAFTAREVPELDQALAVALDFQKKYPEETLIIVTADHETGGLQIDDMEKLKANAPILLKQKGTIASGSAYVDSLINQKMKSEDIYNAICSFIGYDGFSAEEKAQLLAQIATNYDDKAQSVKGSQIFKQAVKYRDAFLGLRYTTGGHSAARILTSVTGPGWENFKREDLENSSLKALIEKSMGQN